MATNLTDLLSELDKVIEFYNSDQPDPAEKLRMRLYKQAREELPETQYAQFMNYNELVIKANVEMNERFADEAEAETEDR